MTDAPNSDSESTVAPTRWALAISAIGDERKEALNDLAASYWYGVYAWWRSAGLDAASAALATVASFTRWLGDFPPDAADSGAGRMREWLPARLAELAESGVELEGPGALAIDAGWAERRYAGEPAGEPDPIFQRAWALTLLEFTVSTLQGEYAAREEDALFAELLSFASFESADDDRYAAAGERVGRSSGAMRKAVFDFRTRQREVLRDIATDTLRDPADTDSELTALLCAIDSPGTETTAMPSGIGGLRPEEALVRAMQSVRMTGVSQGRWQPPSDAEVARLFPQYEILGLVGRGGMGAVYKARQRELDRIVAIKLLPLEVSVDRDFAERFRREARAMAKLSHPHIITVFNFGNTGEGHLFFVMEFVEGANLQDIIRKAGMEPAQALALVAQVCTALAYAHEKGIVHRDIKPANVMVDLAGQAKVADFGLARLNGIAEEPGYTVTGAVLGTPDYMAPEQKHGTKVDHRADIYSVGVMLYEMLCRETPQGAFQPPSQRIGCDTRIDAIVLKAMHQAPDRRYQSTQEMRVAVASALTPTITPPRRRFGPSPPLPKVKAPRRGLPLGRMALAIVAAVIGFLIYENSKGPREIATAPENTEPAPPVAPTPPKTEEPKPLPSKDVVSPAPKTGAAPIAEVPATPEPIPAAPQSATAKWLAEQEPLWQAAYAAEVSGPFEKGVAALNKQYLTTLETQFAASSKAAKLDDAVAFRAERDRMAGGGEVPAEDEATTPASLKTLRAGYRTTFAKLNTERLARAKVVHVRYDTVLQQSQTALTQKHRFDEALEMQTKREALSAAWLQPVAGAAPKAPAVANAWEDLLALLTPDQVEKTGHGWSLKNGQLTSPDKIFATLPLSGDLSGTSYQVRVKLRRHTPKNSFSLILPVADRMVQFVLDGNYEGVRSGLQAVDGKEVRTAADSVKGAQVTDSALHDLEVTVRLEGTNAKISVTLDSGPVYEWAGSPSSLNLTQNWINTPPGSLALGSMSDDWEVSEVKVKRLGQLGARANPPPEPKIDSSGWTDLLAQLTPAEVEKIGHGWSLKNGQLASPDTKNATLALPGRISGTSYQVRVKLRQLTAKQFFLIALPVADKMVGFVLHSRAGADYYTGVSQVNGRSGKDIPGAALGKQVKDSEPHDVEVTVRLDGENATITSTLDAHPLYEWTGPTATLSLNQGWASIEPGFLALGTTADDWVVSEVKVKRLAQLATRANPPPEPKIDADGWTDLIAQLTPGIVEQTGHGWSLKNGQLVSPDTKWATLPLPGKFSGTSYQVRVKLRQLTAKDAFHAVLPVGDRMTGFELDGYQGRYTGLQLVNGKKGKDVPGILEGKQVMDSEPHNLELTVGLDGANATITATLDARPLYEWKGPTAALSENPNWGVTAPGTLALGTTADDWVVSEVKVKRPGK
jgi:serine/threonine protein kinase